MSDMRGDRWATRFGLVMAMAGNAVGLGNFLRFPGQAAPFGGAFMVPYFLALLLMGIPLMWIEWTIGRHGGGFGHGSTPGMFHRLWKHPLSKYLGILGVLLPAMIGVYYVYIESWALGYAYKTLTQSYWGSTTHDAMSGTFKDYLGTRDPQFFSFGPESYFFFLLTFLFNIIIFSRGISKGIEILARFAMPTLLFLGVVLAIRVLTLPPKDGRTIGDGLAQLWVIDWSKLGDPNIWIRASGQVFFTLSLGFGMIHTYASYLRKNEDLTLNGLATISTNEFVEVILGGTITLPAAVIFFGIADAQRTIVEGSSFDIAFLTFPVIFQQMPGGVLFGFLWFILLFLAGLTSSVAMFTPFLSFLEDELRISHKKAVTAIAICVFLMMQPVILFMHRGVIDEIDFWAGTFLLIVFATIEAVVFCWIFGMKKGWEEMHMGADFKIPRIFYPIMLYVTPVYALGLLAWWFMHGFWDALTMAPYVNEASASFDPEKVPYLWLGRAMILGLFIFFVWGVWYAWRTHPKFFEKVEKEKAG